MTCLEKLRELEPEWDEAKISKYIDECCPRHMYIAHDPIWCMKTCDCKKCWNRELKEFDHCNDYNVVVTFDGDDMRKLERLSNQLGISKVEVMQRALKEYANMWAKVDALLED